MATYATLAEVKSELGIDPSDTTDDARLTMRLEVATEVIDLALGTRTGAPRSVTGVAATDVLTTTAHGLAAGAGVQLVSVTGGAGLTVGTQYYVLNPTSDTLQLALAPGAAAVNFTSDLTAGVLVQLAQLVPPPASVKMATLLQAIRFFKRTSAPFGVVGAEEFGNITRLLSRLDPDAELLISGYGQRSRYGTTI